MLVGISGQAGSGKDTVADHLCEKHGFTKVGLADPLKRICKDVFNFTGEQLWGPSENRNAVDRRFPRHDVVSRTRVGDVYLTPRYALQTLGTQWGRDCYPDVWLDYAIQVAKQLQQGLCDYSPSLGLTYRGGPYRPKNTVISDVRFRNEVEGVKKAGGHVFRIVRPGADGVVGVARHASEMEQKDIPDALFNGVIYNNGTLDLLYLAIEHVIVPFIKSK
jgi:hypothetical protein